MGRSHDAGDHGHRSGPPAGLARDAGYVPLDGPPELAYGRPIVVSGRLPDAERAEEVAVNEELAARAGLHLGSRLTVGVYRSDQFG